MEYYNASTDWLYNSVQYLHQGLVVESVYIICRQGVPIEDKILLGRLVYSFAPLSS